jgi:hypothetical protein
MSMSIVDHVCDKSQTQSSARTLLLILAIHANDCCGLAWPAIETLRRKVNVSERQLHYDVKTLRRMGAIQVISGAGPYGTNLYRVYAPGIEPGAPDVAHVNGCRWRDYLAAMATQEGVQSAAPGGDPPGATECTGGVQPIAAEGCNALHPKTRKTGEKNLSRAREETRASPSRERPTRPLAVIPERAEKRCGWGGCTQPQCPHWGFCAGHANCEACGMAARGWGREVPHTPERGV